MRPDALVSAACRRLFLRRPKPRAPKPDNGHETSLAPYNLPSLKLAQENSRYFTIHHLIPREMTSWEVGRNPILMTCHLKLVVRREMLAVFSGYS